MFLPPRRVVVAFALSLLLHGVIFSVLALTSPFTPSFPEVLPEAEAAAAAAEADEPLEVVIQAAPREAEPPEPELGPMVVRVREEHALMRMEATVERTQLDPDFLKKSEKPPENPEFLAAHHSQPGHRKPAPTPSQSPQPAPTPTPTPSPSKGAAPSFRTALPASPESAEPAEQSPPGGSEGEEGEEGGVAAIGAWKKAVANAVGARWNAFRKSKMGLLAVGSVRMKFVIDAQGRVADVRVLSNTAGRENAGFAARSITEAEIPPIPPERLARLLGGRVEVEFTFTIYPAH